MPKKQRVIVAPAVEHASWHISGPDGISFDGTGTLDSDTIAKNGVPPGDYVVTWLSLQGYIPPLPLHIHVAPSATATFHGLYARLISETAAPWKFSGLTMTKHGLVGCIYHNDSRHDVKIFLQTKTALTKIYQGPEETAAQAVEHAGGLVFPGECGHAILWAPDPAPRGTIKLHHPLEWCICIENIGGIPVPHAFNTDYKSRCSVINLLTDESIPMPGDGVINMAVEHEGKIYGAMCNSKSKKKNGISCSDGSLYHHEDCRAIVKYLGRVIYSAQNYLIDLGAGHRWIASLFCEKITHMHVHLGYLWIGCNNPDSVFVMNPAGGIYQLYEFPYHTNMGDSVFGTRVTSGAFSINPGLTQGAAYQILIPKEAEKTFPRLF